VPNIHTYIPELTEDGSKRRWVVIETREEFTERRYFIVLTRIVWTSEWVPRHVPLSTEDKRNKREAFGVCCELNGGRPREARPGEAQAIALELAALDDKKRPANKDLPKTYLYHGNV
jgi:hypothetical protein